LCDTFGLEKGIDERGEAESGEIDRDSDGGVWNFEWFG